MILDKYVDKLRSLSDLEIWSKTMDAISWFKRIASKEHCRLLQGDISDYYTSINEIVFRALIFAKNKVKLARVSILEHRNKLWIRKDTRKDFEMEMGPSDSAEVTDLVGFYLLHELHEHILQLKRGLYRDYAHFLVEKQKPKQLEMYKERLHKLFNSYGLGIVIANEHTIVIYLDTTFKLFEGTYKPHHKENENLKYISIFSNHQPSNKKGLIFHVSRRISSLSSSVGIFMDSADYYNNALAKAGYKEKISYVSDQVVNETTQSGDTVTQY